MLSLPENKEVFEKVKEEANFEGELTYENLQSLPYIQHFIYETLRLFPPVPSDPKTVVKEDVLPGGIRVYPGGLLVFPFVCSFLLFLRVYHLDTKRDGKSCQILSRPSEGIFPSSLFLSTNPFIIS